MGISNTEIVTRLLLAALIGSLMGIERHKHGKPIGSRTHAIICISSALTGMVGAFGFSELEFVRDPTRLSVGVLTGIGFIGAGIIWRSTEGGVQGLTTAANVFATACIGIAIGFGYYFLSVFSALLIVTILTSTFMYGYLLQKRKQLSPQAQAKGDELAPQKTKTKNETQDS